MVAAVLRGVSKYQPQTQREADPKTFVKFMWGKRSNVIVDLKRIKPRELDALIREAWETTKTVEKKKAKKLVTKKLKTRAR